MKEFINTDFTTDAEGARVPDLGGYESNQDVQYSVYDRTQNGGTGALVRVTAPSATMSDIVNATVTTVVTDQDVLDDPSVPFGNGNVGLESLDQPDIEVDEELDALNPSDVLDAEEMDRAYLIHNWTRGPLERADRREILNTHGASDLRNLLYVTDASQRDGIVQEYGLDSFPNTDLATSTIARSVIQNQTRGRQVLQDQELTAMNKLAKAKGLKKADELSKNTRDDMEGEMGHKCKCMLDGRNAEHKEMLDYCKERNGQAPPWAEAGEKPPARGNPNQ